MSELVLLVEILDKLQEEVWRTAGPTLAAFLEPLDHQRNVARLNLLYMYYFGKCSFELTDLVPLPYSLGRSTCHSDRFHVISVTIAGLIRISMSTISFLVQLDFEILCLQNAFR